jgi:hypothetical protein
VLPIGWIVGQIAVIRAFSWFQPAYLAVGTIFIITSHSVTLTRHRRSVRWKETAS